MNIEQLDQWHAEVQSCSDEPWHDQRKTMLPVAIKTAQHIERALGEHNVLFELFDLGTQLGVVYSNSDTARRRTVRIKLTADATAMAALIQQSLVELQAAANG